MNCQAVNLLSNEDMSVPIAHARANKEGQVSGIELGQVLANSICSSCGRIAEESKSTVTFETYCLHGIVTIVM